MPKGIGYGKSASKKLNIPLRELMKMRPKPGKKMKEITKKQKTTFSHP